MESWRNQAGVRLVIAQNVVCEAVLGCACSLILFAYPFQWQGCKTVMMSAQCTISTIYILWLFSSVLQVVVGVTL